MLQSNPAVEPRVPPAAVPKLLERPLKEGCLYVPNPDWNLAPTFEKPLIHDASLSPEGQKYIKRLHRRHKLARFALTAGLLASLPTSFYLSDVRANMAEAAEAKPTIRVMSEALNEDASNKATIFFHGFNTFGASDLVRSIGEGAQQAFEGEQWSVQYNNAPLDAEEISDALNEKLQERHITSVDVVTYSMGDVPGIDAAVDIINNDWRHVESITILSGPADYDGLTEKTKEELSIAKNLAWIPWIEYSTPFRYFAEMYFYKDAIERNPMAAVGGINTRFMNGNVTTNLFLSSQINSISDSDIKGKINSINEDKFRPVINYVKIKDGKDTVVDNDYSAEKICEYANDKGLVCNVFEVNSRHGEYYLSTDEYNAVFEQVGELLRPQVKQEQARYALNLYSYYQLDTVTADDEAE
jgi:hypothetical protein